MDDNQRFISLQYIKGTNYEEIICFNYEKLKITLKENFNEEDITDIDITINNSDKLLDILNNSIDDDKCKIGESLLNDLVNYYNFKDIRWLLKRSLLLTQKYYENKKKNVKKETKKPNKKLTDALNTFKKEIAKKDDIDINISIDPLISFIKGNNQTELDINTETPTEDDIKKGMIEVNLKNIEDFKNKLLKYIYHNLNNIKGEKMPEKKKEGINKIEGYLERLISILERIDIKNNIEFIKDYNNLENIIKLFRYYIRLCNTNIAKYENIFKKNEISNIDDAFMIESYSKFIKKLNILKENLENDDQDKLKRVLINSLNKLFNLYGIDQNKAFGQTEMDYIKNYILYN
jgi:hypothetical protein